MPFLCVQIFGRDYSQDDVTLDAFIFLRLSASPRYE